MYCANGVGHILSFWPKALSIYNEAVEKHMRFMLGQQTVFQNHVQPTVAQVLFMNKVHCLEHLQIKPSFGSDFDPKEQGQAWQYMVSLIIKIVNEICSLLGDYTPLPSSIDDVKKNTAFFLSHPKAILIDDLDAFLDENVLPEFLDFLVNTFPNMHLIYSSRPRLGAKYF